MSIGFIGLGNLGLAIAKRLENTIEKPTVYNRTKSKAQINGFAYANTPRELLSKCDTLFLCLFDSNAVSEILHMQDGLLCDELKGKTIIDLTTNHFDDVVKFHSAVSSFGGNYLEAPVFGSVIPASNGALTLVVSGIESVFSYIKPILQNIASAIFYQKEPGVASKIKLINNLCLGSFMATIAECTALGEACGIDKKEILEILDAGAGKSGVLSAKTKKLLDEDFSPHFSNATINKDLHCLQDLAYSLNRPLYTASVVKELYSKTKMAGMGDEDLSSIYKLFK